MDKLLEKLNEKQREAVKITDGPLLVVAGAGSGKTLVLTSRIAYLIIVKEISPINICAVTFTNKAAREMKERINKILVDHGYAHSLSALSVGTFHSLCLGILRLHAVKIGYTSSFIIFDERDQLKLIKIITEKYKIDEKRFPPELLLAMISKLKNKLAQPENPDDILNDPFMKVVHQVYGTYQKMLKEQNAVDFDDMIMQTVLLLENHSPVKEFYQNLFHYLLIDEYQDTNFAQYSLVRLLSAKHQNICVVGDMDQAIYGWRQADVRNILNFEKTFANTKIVTLEENYRSTGNILSVANALISKNKARLEKNLFTNRGEGEKVFMAITASETHEAFFITQIIKEAVKEKKYTFSDFAVLYRTNAQSRAIEEALVYHRMPYVVVGGFKFYERKEVKDVLSYLRFIINPQDRVNFSRIAATPPRGIGKVSLQKFFENNITSKQIQEFLFLIESLRQKMPAYNLSSFIKEVVKVTGLEKYYLEDKLEGANRWENVSELVSAAVHYDSLPITEALSSLLDSITLASNEDEEYNQDAVRLMTIHSAKGLEFTEVFIPGMEDNIFPHSRSKQSSEELEEERRLCYVAITRAKKKVWLLYAESRVLYGKRQNNLPSRFLADIPTHLVTYVETNNQLSSDFYDLKNSVIDVDLE
ncbi:UvrD-helicase domain-containing protein [Candidatus Azambacteria bacterium]|nr:UvrD-helicase domain-containing protein [Candidatus Azambacteria bacterium]